MKNLSVIYLSLKQISLICYLDLWYLWRSWSLPIYPFEQIFYYFWIWSINNINSHDIHEILILDLFIFILSFGKYPSIYELDLWCRSTCYAWNIERYLYMHWNKYSFIYDEIVRYLFMHLNIYEFGRFNSYLKMILHLEWMNPSSIGTNVKFLIIK